MQYKANTPHEYLEELNDDWRKDRLEEIRKLILTKGADLTERIEYKMLGYGNAESSIFHLNAQKDYVGLYVGNIDKLKGGPEMLEGFDRGKGCIRIKKSVNLNETRLPDFIEAALTAWRAGEDTSC